MFFSIVCFGAVFLSPFSAQADLGKLAKEFVGDNMKVLEAQNNVAVERKEWEFLKADKTWSLAYRPTYDKDTLAAITPFLPPEKTQTDHNFSLVKDFEWGGKLVLTKRFSKLKQSKTPFVPGLQVHSFTNEISYTQNLGADFFGRIFSKELDMAFSRHNTAKKSYDVAVHRGLLQLSLSYVGAKLNKSIVALQQEAASRAKARVDFVRRRVEDGLQEKIDLYRVKSASLSRLEEVQSAGEELKSNLQKLGQALHRKVDKSEIQDYPTLPPSPVKTNGLANRELQLENQKEELLQHQLEKVQYGLLPRVSLKASYRTNDIDPEFSRVVKEGNIVAGDNYGSSLVLSLNWPLGNGPQKIRRSQVQSKQLTRRAKKRKLKQNILLEIAYLKGRISSLDKNIKLSQKRIALAKKILKELSRLYRNGKVDLDQVINAEENLIGTEKGFVRYLAAKETAFYRLSYHYGNVDRYILEDFQQ